MNIQAAAETLWEYHLLHHEVQISDCLLIFCSNDLRVAEYAAALYHAGMARYILCSGGVAHQHDLLATSWDEAEAIVFKKELMKLDVTQSNIFVESAATNTGENARYSRAYIEAHLQDIQKILLVQKPFMERRAFATLKKEWPTVDVSVTSPPILFHDWCRNEQEKEDIIHILVGDTERIWIYSEKGYLIPQVVPEEVMISYHFLKEQGYTKHSIV
jgi:uncharacterized SAM-binding protein YcdF (DUF218 family)